MHKHEIHTADRVRSTARSILLLLAIPFALAALIVAAPALGQDDASGSSSGDSSSSDEPNIYPYMAAQLVERGVAVLDVRSEEEVAETGTVADATRISHDDLDAIETFLGDDPNRAVVVYCGSGRRAERVIEAMRERGYGGLVNAGGYEDLSQALEDASNGG